MTKVYQVMIDHCADCPHKSHSILGREFCGLLWQDKRIDGTTPYTGILSSCPLPENKNKMRSNSSAKLLAAQRVSRACTQHRKSWIIPGTAAIGLNGSEKRLNCWGLNCLK